MRNPLSPGERLRLVGEGARLLAAGRFFQAHEAFEDLWHSTEVPAERDLWQGLAQVSAALVKHDRGEPSTAISLLSKASRRLEGSPLLRPLAVRVKGWLDGLADPITREEELADPALPEPLLVFLERLVAPPPEDADRGGLS